MSDSPNAPQLETVADRLEKLEKSIVSLQKSAWHPDPLAVPHSGPLPDGLAAGPVGGAIVPASVLRAVLPAAVAGEGGTLWSRVPHLAELRLIVRMYFDPRYRLSRVGQFGVPLVLLVMVLNYLLWSTFNIPFLAFVFERVGFAVLVLVAYKILSREAARYAAVLEYLTRYGR